MQVKFIHIKANVVIRNIIINAFIGSEHLLRYRFAKEYLENEWTINKLIDNKEKEMLKNIVTMKDFFCL